MEKYWDIVNIGTYSFLWLPSIQALLYLQQDSPTKGSFFWETEGAIIDRLKMTLRQTFVGMWFTGVHSSEKRL